MVEKPYPEITQKNRIITVLGPTASGKTIKAIQLAHFFNGEIISADSRQVYKNMDLGTGKDLEEYGEVPYHLINICEAGEKYNLHRFVVDCNKVITDVKARNKIPIICGGTGLYLESVLSGIRLPEVPENPKLRTRLKEFDLDTLTQLLKLYKNLHNTTDVDTVARAIRAIEIEEFYRNHPEEAKKADRNNVKMLNTLIIGIDIPRELRRQKITERLQKRLDSGMVNEVKTLIEKGVSPQDLIYYGLEYKYLTLYVIGEISYTQMVKELEIAIHQFAKRQMTWFRGMERRGFKINWLPFDMNESEFIYNVSKLYSK